MDTVKVMLVLSERQWTLQALHLACALVRNQGGEIVLVKMVPVRHPAMLGTAAGYLDFTDQEEQAIRDFAATAEDYNVPFSITLCQYASYSNAVLSAAEQLQARIIFAPPPRSVIPLWSVVQQWWLKQSLARGHRTLYTLQQAGASPGWTPSITLPKKGRPAIGDK
ncbi:MAG: hypothetical protein L0332_25860 [Chloroflexi bacterium]|nr:hypothetical protein [Chloroflexota bacterium]MCI0575275.1 hypothetical protein [Chloroflexota bacterium]MCI0645721.1 hypothetical protein [Chloroflexota bacterium]MCI0730126.1 hypothetical protein [Chloroflexota bacterium]